MSNKGQQQKDNMWTAIAVISLLSSVVLSMYLPTELLIGPSSCDRVYYMNSYSVNNATKLIIPTGYFPPYYKCKLTFKIINEPAYICVTLKTRLHCAMMVEYLSNNITPLKSITCHTAHYMDEFCIVQPSVTVFLWNTNRFYLSNQLDFLVYNKEDRQTDQGFRSSSSSSSNSFYIVMIIVPVAVATFVLVTLIKRSCNRRAMAELNALHEQRVPLERPQTQLTASGTQLTAAGSRPHSGNFTPLSPGNRQQENATGNQTQSAATGTTHGNQPQGSATGYQQQSSVPWNQSQNNQGRYHLGSYPTGHQIPPHNEPTAPPVSVVESPPSYEEATRILI